MVLSTGSTVVASKGRLTVPDSEGVSESLQHAIDTRALLNVTRTPVMVPPAEAEPPVALRFPVTDHVVQGAAVVPVAIPPAPASDAPDPIADLHAYFPTTTTEDPS